MSAAQYISVPISSISVPSNRARALDKDWAQALASMFKDHGNKTAIELRHDPENEGQFILVSGLHRLEAAKINKWDELIAKLIEADSEQDAAEYRLHEVMENIGRRELTILDRAHHLFEFDAAYKKLHPELKHGGDRKSDEAKENQVAILAIRSEVAEKVGLSDRAIRRAVQLWKSLTKASRDRIDGTWLADHQAGLMALADHKAKMQANILDVLFDEEREPKSVADAIIYIQEGRLETPAEKRVGSVLSTFSKLDDDLFDRVLSSQRERVEAWLARQDKN